MLWLNHRKGIEAISAKFLSILFGLVIGLLLNYYAYLHEVRLLFYMTFLFEDVIIFVCGPVILGFVLSYQDTNYRLPRSFLLHLLPAFTYTCFISIPVLYYFITREYIFAYVEKLDGWEFLLPFQILYLMGYVLASLWYWHRANSRALPSQSTRPRYHRRWVRNLLWGLLGVCIVDLCSSFYELFFGELSWDTALLSSSSIVILIGYLGYHGIARSGVLLPHIPSTSHQPEKGQARDFKNELQADSIEHVEMTERLAKIMEHDQLFKDTSLTLRQLAEALNTTDKKLSEYLNKGLKRSFYDLVNEYRVSEVKRILTEGEHEHLTVQGIAQEAGFKSKTSFHRSFKKMTGMTPTQFKSQLQSC